MEFLHRKVAWNAESVSWTHDPKHTLAMADGFGFNGKKQLEQTKWKVTVAPGPETVGKGLRDGADGRARSTSANFWMLNFWTLRVGPRRAGGQNLAEVELAEVEHPPDGLDEQETQQYRSLVGTAKYLGQDRPETQCATTRSSEIHVWSNACREVHAQTFVPRHPNSTGVFHIKKCQVRSGR